MVVPKKNIGVYQREQLIGSGFVSKRDVDWLRVLYQREQLIGSGFVSKRAVDWLRVCVASISININEQFEQFIFLSPAGAVGYIQYYNPLFPCSDF